VHHLANSDRDAIVERLIAFNNKERYYTYSIMKGPFLVIRLLTLITKSQKY